MSLEKLADLAVQFGAPQYYPAYSLVKGVYRMSKRKIGNITGGAGSGRAMAQRRAGPLMRGGGFYSQPRSYVPRRMSFRSTNELKSVDSSSISLLNAWPNPITVGTTTSIQLLNGTEPGSGFFNRIGRKVHFTSINMKFALQIINGTARSSDEDTARISVVWDRAPLGVLPSYFDIFQECDAAGNTASGLFSGVNLNNRARFLVLKDWHIWLAPINVAATGFITLPTSPDGGNLLEYSFFKNLKPLNMETTYKADTGAIGDFVTGACYLVITAGNTNATSCWTLAGSSRMRFLDG
jgi:hypothetical protein